MAFYLRMSITVSPGAMEPYPIVDNGVLRGFVLSCSDFVIYYDKDGRRIRTVYMYSPEEGVLIDGLLQDNAFKIGKYTISLTQWIDEPPLIPFYTIDDVESYVEFLAKSIGDVVRGKRVMVSFSGGKDSFIALYVLSLLRNYVDFRLIAVYTYMPILEPEDNIEIAGSVAERLDVEFIEVRPDLHVLKKFLMAEGLPYRRARWCTYLKTRPLRKLRKGLNVDYVVNGDRLVEAGKRLFRLLPLLLQGKFVSGKKLRPTYTFTILDVIKACRSANYIHPDYIKGLPRVSCSYCPYKSIHEFVVTRETGWEGLIEEVMRREYMRWYKRRGIPYDDFVGKALWRFMPGAAYMWHRVSREVEKMVERGELERVKADEVRKDLRRPWIEPLPDAPVKGVLDEVRIVVEWIRRRARRETVEKVERALERIGLGL